MVLTKVLELSAQTATFRDSNFSSPLSFQGNLDSLIVDNCTFQNFNGEAIRFENVQYVEIKNSSFINLSNTISTRAIVCGKKANAVLLKNLKFNNIGGTAIRFPTDGESSALQRLGIVTIDSVFINGTSNPGGLESNGIRVFLTDTLHIRNCFIKNIADNAINLGRNSSGQTQINQRIHYCEIHHNTIDSILGNGILAAENAGKAFVHHNIISNIAVDGVGMLPTDGDHGMYWQSPDAAIYENRITNVLDGLNSGQTGSGISLRTNARVYQNEIANCTRNGIGYWNDHPGSVLLELTNNLIYETGLSGIYINGSGGNPNLPDSVVILHNTVHNIYQNGLVFHYSPIALNNLNSYNYVAGNLLLFDNITDTADFIRFLGNISSRNSAHNFYADTNSGFVNLTLKDYHLAPNSPAINFVPFATSNVTLDKDNNLRTHPLDAGCYEYASSNKLVEKKDFNAKIYPNPGKGIFNISFDKNTELLLAVYDMNGRFIAAKTQIHYGLAEIDLTDHSNGIYILELRSDLYTFRARIHKIGL